MKAVRPIRTEGDIAYVTLTRGLVAVIDAVDVPLVAMRNWQAIPRRDGKGFYACSTIKDADQHSHLVQMHRAITGADPGQEVDHGDGDGLHNRRHNLTVCTKAQNQQHRLRTSNKTGFKGVSFVPSRRKFAAVIRVDGKRRALGRFATAELAAAAYDAAAVRYFGAFAATNEMVIGNG
jgi:hypothetical protein